MRISMLKLKNCLGIKELEFKPGQITLIEGEEKQGKTSILESIQRFFWNKSERASFVYKDDEGPAEKAETYIDLDDGTTMKKYINSENKVTTTGIEKDGMSPKSPETFLKSLVNEKQLNPISLIYMGEKELADLVLSLMPIKVTEADVKEWLLEVPPFIDYNKHGLQVCKDIEKAYYDMRTKVNQRVKDLEGEVKGEIAKLPKDYDPEAWRYVSMQEKYDAIKDANKVNADRQKCQAQIDNVKTKIEGIEEARDIRVKQLEDEIQKVKNDAKYRIDVENNNVVIAKDYLEKNPEIDVEPLETAQKEAEEMKSYVRTADDLAEKQKELEAKKAESQKLTEKVEYMRTKPQMLLAGATMPVEGITVDGQGNVLVNSRPIINLSGGERIKFVMNIVRATAGPLKIILINGFEALSPKGQKEFIDECTGDGFQYIITKVTDGELKIKAIDESGNVRDAETGEVI